MASQELSEIVTSKRMQSWSLNRNWCDIYDIHGMFHGTRKIKYKRALNATSDINCAANAEIQFI